MAGVHIVWFKRDLRIHDHAALAAAAEQGAVLPLFIVEPVLRQQPDYAGRHWAFAAECLDELRAQLVALGQPLVVRVGIRSGPSHRNGGVAGRPRSLPSKEGCTGTATSSRSWRASRASSSRTCTGPAMACARTASMRNALKLGKRGTRASRCLTPACGPCRPGDGSTFGCARCWCHSARTSCGCTGASPP